jgi:DNA-3-methyladenine glycosylase II
VSQIDLWTTTGTLRPTAPFDFAQSLRFIGEFMPTRDEQRLERQSLCKAVRVGSRTLAFKLTEEGTIDRPELTYTLYSEQPRSSPEIAAAEDGIGFYLSIHDDLQLFYAAAAADPPFARVVERLYGYHQVKFVTPFENACWAILTQRTPMAAARRAKDQLSERFGGAIAVDGEVYRAFPGPDDLAAAAEPELAALSGNERKGRYLAAAARAFGGVEERWLREAPYAEVERWLLAIDGIGAWSAAFILVRGLGRMERLPQEERLVESASNVYGRPLDLAAVEKLAERYGTMRAYWAHYLRAAT